MMVYFLYEQITMFNMPQYACTRVYTNKTTGRVNFA